MGRGWCVGRPGSVTGQRVSRQAEERQGACGPTCIGDRQLLHRNEPTFAPASRAREHAWWLQRPRLVGAEKRGPPGGRT